MPWPYTQLPVRPPIDWNSREYALEKYDGTTCVKQFISKFKQKAILLNWPPSEQAKCISMLLKGRAFDIYNYEVRDKSSIDCILETLQASLGLDMSKAMSAFNSKTPSLGQDSREFGEQLRSLIEQAMPDAPLDVRLRQLKDHFLRFCSEPIQVTCEANKDMTWREILDLVSKRMPTFGDVEPIETNAIQSWQKSQSKPQQSSNRQRDQSTQNNRGRKHNNDRPNNKQERSKSTSQIQCFTCGGYNHYSADCLLNPRNKKSNKSNKQQQHSQKPAASTTKAEANRIVVESDNNVNELMRIQSTWQLDDLEPFTIETLVDPGSTHSLLSVSLLPTRTRALVEQFRKTKVAPSHLNFKLGTVSRSTVDSETEETCVFATFKLSIGPWTGDIDVIITSTMKREVAIIAKSFLRDNRITIDFGADRLYFPSPEKKRSTCFTTRKYTIPPKTQAIINATIVDASDYSDQDVVVEPFSSHADSFIVARSLDRVTVSYTHLTLPTKRIV